MPQSYSAYAKKRAARSPLLANTLSAFLVGGSICALGQMLLALYERFTDPESARSLSSMTLILLAALFTGLDLFDSIARHAGAGTLVPITGFSNAITSAAIDNRDEGWVPGLGAKIFTIAGPVILYGTVAGVVWGILYRIMTLMGL